MKKTTTALLLSPRVRLALISIFSALLIAYIFLIPHNPGAFRAVPPQTSFLLEFNGLVKVGNQVQAVKDKTWKNVLQATLFQNCWTEVAFTSRLFQNERTVSASFAKNKLLAAFSMHPADSLQPLFALELDASISLKKVLEANGSSVKIFPYQFRGQTLFTVHLSPNTRIVVASKGPLLLFSRFSYLVEDALTQLENHRGWWADNRYLGDLNPNACLKLFFRPEKWLAQNKGNLYPLARLSMDAVTGNIAWVGLAWDGEKTTGMCEPKSFMAELGAWKGAARDEMYNFLPDNTALVAWAGFDNASLFFKQLLGGGHADFNRFVLPWLGNEAALVFTEPLSEAMADDRLLLLSVRDSTKAVNLLESYGQARGLLARERIGMFDAFGFQGQSLAGALFSEKDMAFQNPYFAHLGKFVVVAPNRASLEVFIDKYISNQTLAQNTDFLQLKHQLQPSGRGLLLLNGVYLTRMLNQLFQEKNYLLASHADIEAFSKIGWVGATLEPGIGRKMHIELSVQKQAVPMPETNIYWKTALGAPAISPVFVIPQPGMPESSALLVQDDKSQLYCLKPGGEITWQKPVGARIISSIKAIDFFENGRNCYLFNTETHVWIIDDKGKEVQGYPLLLKARATTGACTVNMGSHTALNFFLCSENGNAYGFDALGRALDGWNPQAHVGEVVADILHFQYLGKDYLAVLNKHGGLSVFGRDGKLRFPKVSFSGTFRTAAMLDKSGTKPRIICVSQEGQLFSCGLDGQYFSQNLIEKPEGLPVIAAQIPMGAKSGLALLQGRLLSGYHLVAGKAQNAYSIQISGTYDNIFTAESGIGLCETARGKIALFDREGKMVKGFPLAGSTPFGFFQLRQQKVLVTGNGSAVYAYKMRD